MYRNVIMLTLFVALISACCTKEYCFQNHALSFKFYGFKAAEVDTVEITGYSIGSGFTQVSRAMVIYDATQQKGEDSTYNLTSQTGRQFDDAVEWKVYIPATGASYVIGNYGYEVVSCNNCKFKKDDKVKSLRQCTVNGEQSTTLVPIRK